MQESSLRWQDEGLCLDSEGPGSHGSFGVEDKSDLNQILMDFLWVQSEEQTIGLKKATTIV